MQAAQIGLDTPNGQPQAGAQVGDQAGNPHADAPLTEHHSAQIEFGAVPALAVRTETFDDPMLNPLDRLGFGQLKHLTRIVEAVALQAIVTLGAALEEMLNAAGRCHALATMVVVWRALFALCFGLGRFRTIGLDEGWRVSVLLL